MAPEPRTGSVDMPQLLWNNRTALPEGASMTTQNTTTCTHADLDSADIRYVMIHSVSALICLCGLAGNGTVVWLLGFRVKRNPYSVYILNLAVADFIYLLVDILYATHYFLTIFCNYCPGYLFDLLMEFLFNIPYCAGQCLLMAISSERCVSVLWPIWYKCRRPAQLSTIVCTVIWSLSFAFAIVTTVCRYFDSSHTIIRFDNMLPLITFLVLSVCGLTLVIRVQCCSRQRKPSKLYVTILLNVLAFLLLCVPSALYLTWEWTLFFGQTALHTIYLLYDMNCSINPVIYFLVGRQGQWRGRKTLPQLLQNALTDDDEASEQRRGITGPRQDETSSEQQ